MTKQYPTWAPHDLCEFHKIMLGHAGNNKSKITKDYLANSKRFQILEKLLFNKEMKKVWPVVKKYSESGYLRNIPSDDELGFVNEILRKHRSYGNRLLSNVTTAYAYSLIKYKSRKEKKEYYKSVSILSSELANLIKKTDFDVSPRIYHPDYDQREDDGKMLYEDDLNNFTLSKILLQMHHNAAIYELMVDDETQVLPYPNMKNAQRLAFIRILSLRFMEDYKHYLYGTLATIARCILDDPEIDERVVIDTLKNWSGDMNTIPEWKIIG